MAGTRGSAARTTHLKGLGSLLLCGLVLAGCSDDADSTTSTTAAQVPSESGPTTITGTMTYTNPFFTAGVAQPVVILEDQGGFVTRDRNFVISVESQVLATITSDFYTSPVTYSLSLPAVPHGTLHDVDQDTVDDPGVMVFAIAYWTNTWGDPYLEVRDQFGGGWSSAYASTKVSDDRDTYLEVIGGKLVVYAVDGDQQFPSGFGDDGLLFTDDDPVTDLDAGWTVVDLDQTPFGLDRSATPTVELHEGEASALTDFSALSYTEAFDGMLEKLQNEYAFTEYKDIDWAARAEQFRPGFEAAEEAEDPHAYALALRDFLWSIPDAHIGFDLTLLESDFEAETAGGLGLAIRETDDGKIIANYILEDGPADEAGMRWGAEIVSFDGTPIAEVVEENVPWSSPFSNPFSERLQQLRYATRFRLEVGQVDVAFINPGGAEQTAVLDVVEEFESFNSSSVFAGIVDTALPVEYEILPSGDGYIRINSFFDNDVLTIQLWERAITHFNEGGITSVVLDLRWNGGGNGWLADQMAAYFFEEETLVGNTAFYDDSTGGFELDAGDATYMIPPREGLQFHGSAVVIVGPACFSACEFFAYAMTVDDRATIVGHYPSAGAGGSVESFLMPEDISVQFPLGRSVDQDGEIHIEGTGIVPGVRVPVTFETLQRIADGADVVLETAVQVVSQPAGAGITPSGPPTIATTEAAASAYEGGDRLLEQLAREQYDSDDYAVPGTLTFTVPLLRDESLIWMYAWCTSSAAILDQNFENIELTFRLDGVVVSPAELAEEELESDGQHCRLFYTALSEWPSGEHHLSITARFTEQINDGFADYAAGDYILEYNVFVKP